MKFKVVVRLIVLVFSFGMTVFGIYLLKSDYGIHMFEALGFRNGENYVSWCQSRVAKISDFNSKFVVEEKSRKWLVTYPSAPGQNSNEITYLDMERWLGEYCQVKVDTEVKGAEAFSQTLTPLFNIFLIDGTEEVLYRVGPDSFQILGRIFKSEELEVGLKKFNEFVKNAPTP